MAGGRDRRWGGGRDRPSKGGGGGGAWRLLEGGGGGVTDRWSPALGKRAARRRVRLSAKARGALAGRGADRPLQGVGGGMTDVRGGGGLTDLGLGGLERPLRRGGGGGRGAQPVGDRGSASGSLKKRAARRRVRLSEKARGAAARPAL